MSGVRRLASHGRFKYSPITSRPAFRWPNGARLAVYLGVNVEVFDFGSGKGAELAPMANQPDVLNWSWREYGNRVGIWRLLDLLEVVGWGPVGAIINTACYEECPEVVEAMRRRGDEMIAHGHTNSEMQGSMSLEDERELIRACTAIMTAKEGGVAPRGWLSPWISESRATPDLLHEAGYTYTLNWAMDDMPVRMTIAATTTATTTTTTTTSSSSVDDTPKPYIWSIPYQQECNDIPSIVARKDSAAEFAEMIIDSFDEQLQQATRGEQPLVLGIALHPYLVGQPHRIGHLRRALHHIKEQAAAKGGVWFTTPGELVRFIEEDKSVIVIP